MMAGKSAFPNLIASALWVLLFVFWFARVWSEVADLRTAGQYVTTWRYAEIALLVVALLVWLWNGWTSWKRYRADEGLV